MGHPTFSITRIDGSQVVIMSDTISMIRFTPPNAVDADFGGPVGVGACVALLFDPSLKTPHKSAITLAERDRIVTFLAGTVPASRVAPTAAADSARSRVVDLNPP